MTATEPNDAALGAAVAEVYQRSLALEIVHDDCDFFDYGGHSILAVLAISELSARLNTKVPLRLIFEHRTVAELTRAIRAHVEREEADAASGNAE